MELKGQKPLSTSGASQSQPLRRTTEGNSITMLNRESSNKPLVIGIVIVAIVVLGGLAWWATSMMKGGSGIMSDRYQAVFLTNNQVYFGKLSNVDSQYVDLTDIYYLQVQQSVQPTDGKDTNPQVSLAKLGSELHGPENHMRINRDQILFWENLKDDGKVVDAIKKNQK